MRNLLLLIILVLQCNVNAQYNSRDWLNLKGNVESLRQTKFKIGPDTLLSESSDLGRFEEMIFMSIGQQLLIDNSFLKFSKNGIIERWLEFNSYGDTLTELKFTYVDKLLPVEMRFLKKHTITNTVMYVIDSTGLFESIETKNIQVKITRDFKNRVISEIISLGEEQTKFIYEYLNDGTIRIHMIKNEALKNTLENTLNKNGDFEFDGKYTFKYKYDSNGNWITKTGFIDSRPTVKFVRKIEYY
jgi:hypothetical protein